MFELKNRAHVSVVEIVDPAELERLADGEPLPPTEITVDVHADASLTTEEADWFYRGREVASRAATRSPRPSAEASNHPDPVM